MNERIAGVETRLIGVEKEVSALHRLTNWQMWALALFAAIVVAGFAHLSTRIDRVDDKLGALSENVAALPDRINANLLELNRTLAESITAARSAEQPPAPIVIQVPRWPDDSPPKPAND